MPRGPDFQIKPQHRDDKDKYQTCGTCLYMLKGVCMAKGGPALFVCDEWSKNPLVWLYSNSHERRKAMAYGPTKEDFHAFCKNGGYKHDPKGKHFVGPVVNQVADLCGLTPNQALKLSWNYDALAAKFGTAVVEAPATPEEPAPRRRSRRS